MTGKSSLLIIALSCLLPLFGISQNTSPEVLAGAGSDGSTSNAQVSWTLGETVIPTLTGTNQVLTQGFHQTGLIITRVEDPHEEGLQQVEVFPNPADEFLHVRWPVSNTPLQLRLVDTQGRIMLRKSISSGDEMLDVRNYATGPYYLQVSQHDRLETFKIQIIR